MRRGRPRVVGVLAAVALLMAFAAYFMVHKNCCGLPDDDELRRLEVAAEAGDVTAMKRLCVHLDESGQPEKADAWLKRAADTGDAEAEFTLWDVSAGTQKVAATTYLRRSAEHGFALAQLTLGELYRDGVNLPKDVQMARYWLHRSADSGDPAGVIALCDLAVAQRDVQLCRDCIELQNRVIVKLKADAPYVRELRQQQTRITSILRQRLAR
jgi:TPR repeat protein